MQIGKRVYFDNRTGNAITVTGETSFGFETSFEQDYEFYPSLKAVDKQFIGCKQLQYGENCQEFAECDGFRVNVETKELEFSYPDPSKPDAPQVFQKPLTEQIKELQTQLKIAQDAIDFLVMNGGM